MSLKVIATSRYEVAAWVLFAAGLLWLLTVHLLSSLLAGLLIFTLVEAVVRLSGAQDTRRETTRMLAVALIASVLIALISAAILSLMSYLRNGGDNVPALIQRMAEIVEHSRASLPQWLLPYVPTSTEELRAQIVFWLRTHAEVFQVAGTGVGRALAHILIGMVVGALVSLETAKSNGDRGPLAAALMTRARNLARAFRRVVFAQVRISAINTVFTGIYLLVVLPGFGVTLPFGKTLVLMTFLLGLVPILGNLVSNTMIFIVSLSQSLYLALASLGYLVGIHKLEYFLNARIVGSEIRARAWEILLAMLAMEAAFGIAGLIAAPVYYAFMKDELRSKHLV